MNGMRETHKPVSPHAQKQVAYVSLDFACCGCTGPVCVTLRCEGSGLAGEAARSVAAVNIPCPTCGQVNQLLFEPRGRVRDVRPWPGLPAIPEPSLN
jgi:hypothetical protein